MDDALPRVGMTKRFLGSASTTARNALRSGWSPWAATPGSPDCLHAVVGMPSVVLAEPGQRRRGHTRVVSGSRVAIELEADRVKPLDKRSRPGPCQIES